MILWYLVCTVGADIITSDMHHSFRFACVEAQTASPWVWIFFCFGVAMSVNLNPCSALRFYWMGLAMRIGCAMCQCWHVYRYLTDIICKYAPIRAYIIERKIALKCCRIISTDLYIMVPYLCIVLCLHLLAPLLWENLIIACLVTKMLIMMWRCLHLISGSGDH